MEGAKNNTGWLQKVIGNFMPVVPSVKTEIKDPMADYLSTGGTYRNIGTFSYNGEKNLGEAGPIRSYAVNYEALSLRSWALQLESELAQTIIGRYDMWVVGSGLKLQSEPSKTILEAEGITLDRGKFTKNIEERFNLYKKSKHSDYSGMKNLDMLASTAHRNAIIGGDVLVILRYIDDCVKVQLVDGAHVQSPVYGSESYPQDLANGNKIINGIEIDPCGKHVSYWIRQSDYSMKKVDAVGAESGLTMAFMVYGLEYRLNNVRGLPLLSACIETLKKMERYKEATLATAEEVAKISYTIEHELGGTGENPLDKGLARAFDASMISDQIPKDINNKALQDLVYASTNKTTINLPNGAKIKSLQGSAEIHFKEFYEVNTDILCATVSIPPNVAMSKYDTSFSSARAAIKDWENTLNVKREYFAFQFYKPIYDFFMEVCILKNKINAPGYMVARLKDNYDVVESYRKCRFLGAPVPHIDPVKEATAARIKLGTAGLAIPLTTVERATEELGCGESESNMEQFAEELAESIKFKIVAPVTTAAVKETP